MGSHGNPSPGCKAPQPVPRRAGSWPPSTCALLSALVLVALTPPTLNWLVNVPEDCRAHGLSSQLRRQPRSLLDSRRLHVAGFGHEALSQPTN